MDQRENAALANCLRTRRRQANLSQAALAKRAGTTRQTVSALEVGSYTPTMGVALRLARVLGC